MSRDQIVYNDWETGEEFTRDLSSSYPAEKQTDLVCPFDNTRLLFSYDETNKWYSCPNCNISYLGIEKRTQEEVERVAKEHFQSLEERSKKLSNEQNEILKVLKVAESKGLHENNSKN